MEKNKKMPITRLEFHVKYVYHFSSGVFEGYFAYKGTIKGLYYISNGVERGFFFCNLIKIIQIIVTVFMLFPMTPHKLSLRFFEKNIFSKIQIIVTFFLGPPPGKTHNVWNRHDNSYFWENVFFQKTVTIICAGSSVKA